MALSFDTQNGQTVTEGDSVTLVLQHGSTQKTVEGVVRAFEHSDRVLDDEGMPLAPYKVTSLRWEISTGNPKTPAIGFVPENVVSAE